MSVTYGELIQITSENTKVPIDQGEEQLSVFKRHVGGCSEYSRVPLWIADTSFQFAGILLLIAGLKLKMIHLSKTVFIM